MKPFVETPMVPIDIKKNETKIDMIKTCFLEKFDFSLNGFSTYLHDKKEIKKVKIIKKIFKKIDEL